MIVAVIFFFVGRQAENKRHQEEIAAAKKQANQIIEDARQTAKKVSEKVRDQGQKETDEFRDSTEDELESYQADNVQRDHRITQRQSSLQATSNRLDEFHDRLEQAKSDLKDLKNQISVLHQTGSDLAKQRVQTLEKVGDITVENAKQTILDQLKVDLAAEKETELRYQNDDDEVNAPKEAKRLALDAIQRGPVDFPREQIEHSVTLNDEEVKKKLVGKEESNLRFIEALTGVDLLFDPDDPLLLHVVTADPLRREVAHEVVSNLVVSRQINASTINNQVTKARKDLGDDLRKTGEQVATSLKIGWVHPDLMKIIGRLKYRTSYGQNVLNHSIEVAQIAGILAADLGLDVRVAKRAGLFHDIGKAIDHEVDGTHVELGVKIAQVYKESPEVINSIASHHGDVEVTTPIAYLVAAGDSISGGRPGARSESVEEYINRLKSLEEIANTKPGVKESYAIQAGREIRVIVDPRKVDDSGNVQLSKQIASQIKDELTYPGKIKVTSIRDFKAISYVGAETKKRTKKKKQRA